MGFADLITALQNGEIDVIMSAMTITPDRSQEIDFIAYLNAGTGILVAAGNLQGIRAFEDLCGLRVAVQGDTIQVAQVNELNGRACADSRIDLLTFSENPLAVEQLRVGGADAVLADDAVVVNEASLSEGQLEVVVSALEPAPYGIGVRKESSALRAALEDALRRLIDNGTYADILEEWNLTSGSVE
jgi:polar amino acid transport system substrate-binding protein